MPGKDASEIAPDYQSQVAAQHPGPERKQLSNRCSETIPRLAGLESCQQGRVEIGLRGQLAGSSNRLVQLQRRDQIDDVRLDRQR